MLSLGFGAINGQRDIYICVWGKRSQVVFKVGFGAIRDHENIILGLGAINRQHDTYLCFGAITVYKSIYICILGRVRKMYEVTDLWLFKNP